MKNKGDQVYDSLMDLDLILQDIEYMGPLKIFLGSIKINVFGLQKLHTQILDLKQKIELLAAVAKNEQS